ATITALDGVLPPTWSHGNPVDIVGDAGALRYTRALEILVQDAGVSAVLVMNCPTALASSLDVAQAIVGAIDRHRDTSRATKPVITNWLGEEASRGAGELFAANDIAS